MSIRPTQASTYSLVQQGLTYNLAKMVRAQEQVATGKRIVRPSDDPSAAARALGLKGRISASARYTGAIDEGRGLLDSAAASLQQASTLLSEARALALQAMNGVQTPGDRKLLADQVELIRDQLLDLANSKSGDRYVFAGTATDQRPWETQNLGGVRAARYIGNRDGQELLVGPGVRMAANIPGSSIFAAENRTDVMYGGLTGVTPGISPALGQGFEYLTVRHDATSGTPGAGIAFVAAAADTILGAHTVSIDSVANTATLDGGKAVALPAPGSPELADVTLTNGAGAVLHLDFSGWTGAATSFAVNGAGSISLDGVNYTALTFTQNDLQITNATSGTVLHVNETTIHRAGVEQVVFGGAINLFDTLQAMANVFRDPGTLSQAERNLRADTLLEEFDRNTENVVGSLGALGARSARLSGLRDSHEDTRLQLRSLLSLVEDADFAEVALDLARAEQTLQQTQLASTRLLQTSLLNFLR